jgi:hypothetical protein
MPMSMCVCKSNDMNLNSQIAKQLRDVHFGGNWTWSTLKEHLSDVTWQQATTSVYGFNTIAMLVFHMNYYLNTVHAVLEGNPLTAKHALSFDLPPITSQEDWEKLLEKTWADAENFAQWIEKVPESKLWDDFAGGKYGNFYRNIQGIIEHNHYHLGQIVLIKKILLQS